MMKSLFSLSRSFSLSLSLSLFRRCVCFCVCVSGACFVWVTAGFLGHRVGIRSFMNAWRGILARRLSRLCGFVGVSLCGFMVCGFLCVWLYGFVRLCVGGFVGLWRVARGRSFVRGIRAPRFPRLFSAKVVAVVWVSGCFGLWVHGLWVFVCVALWVCSFVCGWVCRLVARGAWT